MYEKAKKDFKLKKTRTTSTISMSVYMEFKEYCDENNYCKQRLIECILEEYLEKFHPGYKDNYESSYVFDRK